MGCVVKSIQPFYFELEVFSVALPFIKCIVQSYVFS